MQRPKTNIAICLLTEGLLLFPGETEDKELAWRQKANWKPCLPFLKLSLWPLAFYFLLFYILNFYFSLSILDFHIYFSQTEDKELAWWQKANWKPCLPFLKLSLWTLTFYFLLFYVLNFYFSLLLLDFHFHFSKTEDKELAWWQKSNWKPCLPFLKLSLWTLTF